MEGCKVLAGVIYLAVMTQSFTILPNLRRYRVVRTVGRFVVPRAKLETIIKEHINEDNQCGNYVSLSLPKSLPSEHYDESLYGELTIAFGTLEEEDVEYIRCDSKDPLETSYRNLLFEIPFVSNGNHGVLNILEITEAKNRLTPPILTSDGYRLNVDAIDQDGDTVTLRTKDDEMTLDVSGSASCQTCQNVGNDFDQLHGINVTATTYPKRFDWNCGSVLDWDSGYCRALKDNLCEIQRFDGDVCVHVTTRSSVRCPSVMRITSASGVFLDALMGMFDTFPVESFEAELIDRDHEAGIKYPCLSKQFED